MSHALESSHLGSVLLVHPPKTFPEVCNARISTIRSTKSQQATLFFHEINIGDNILLRIPVQLLKKTPGCSCSAGHGRFFGNSTKSFLQ